MVRELRASVDGRPVRASSALPKIYWLGYYGRAESLVPPVHSPQVRPPPLWPGSIWYLPPTRVGWLFKTALGNQPLESDFTFSFAPPVMLVNGNLGLLVLYFT